MTDLLLVQRRATKSTASSMKHSLERTALSLITHNRFSQVFCFFCVLYLFFFSFCGSYQPEKEEVFLYSIKTIIN